MKTGHIDFGERNGFPVVSIIRHPNTILVDLEIRKSGNGEMIEVIRDCKLADPSDGLKLTKKKAKKKS